MIRFHGPARALVLFAIVAGATCARAQDAAPPGAPAAANCTKPGDPPPNTAKAERAKFQQQLNDYQTCVTAYAKSNMATAHDLQEKAKDFQAKAQAYETQAHVYADAANGAIEDFNTYAIDVNKKRDEAAKK